MDPLKIDRINALANKLKTVGLTPEEANEQQYLRKKYIKAFRGNLKTTLDNIILADEKGNQRALRKDR